MIYITGDTHGDFRRFGAKWFKDQKEMTKDDTLIILGDFGGVWYYKGESEHEKYQLDWLEGKNYTTVFIDGNHDCFPRIYDYPVKEWNGGLVHEIRPSVLHLMRGEIFTIEGLTFWAFGGASSHDISDGILDPVADAEKIKEWYWDYSKLFRIKGVTWWPEELPTEEEMQHGINTLADHGNKVDYLLTHSPATSTLNHIGQGRYAPDKLSDYLDDVRANTEFKRHFMGHMHTDWDLNETDWLMYEEIIRIN